MDMGTTGVGRVLESTEPMKMARQFMRETYETPKGRQGLWRVLGSWWVWGKGKWGVVEDEVVETTLWRWLEDMSYQVATGVVRLGADRKTVGDVYAALVALTLTPRRDFPCWVGREGPEPGSCIAFEDVVVSVQGGKVEVVERDEDWMDLVVLPCKWEPEAKAERWHRALGEWGQGDGKWGELLQWWMGYMLMSKRGYAKWLLMQGKTRGGKGVIAQVQRALVGRGAWSDVSQMDLASDFALEGMEWARVINIPEVAKGDEVEKQGSNRVMKSVLGEDPQTVNGKYQRRKRGVVIRAVIQMSANMIPVMPNEGEGISSKMLVLPFVRSFKLNPQHDLKEVLMGELAGIAAWAVEGARKLEEGKGNGWPEPEAAKDVVLRFRLQNNELDGFLEARCRKDPEGFVEGEILWREWEDYVRENKVRVWMPRNQFLVKVEEESTWDLKRGRRRVGEQNRRGMFGLALRKREEGEGDQV